MVRKVFLEDPGKYLCVKTKDSLKKAKENYMDQDQDYFGLVVADKTGVGLGKSTFWMLLCAYMDILINGMNNRRFHLGQIFFDSVDFRFGRPKLKRKDCFGFDEPDAFFSLTTTTKEARKLKLDIIHLRQQNFFFFLCADSPFSVSSWVRPGGNTRISAIFRIVKRGVCYVYSQRTGTMNKIKMDSRTRQITWPEADVIIYFKRIPKSTEWWQGYDKKKTAYLKGSDESPKVMKALLKEKKR